MSCPEKAGIDPAYVSDHKAKSSKMME